MEAQFWFDSWEQGGSKTSFHRPDLHPYVTEYCTPEFLAGKRILIPLCGKTNEIAWFQQYADHVIGVELVQTAIQQYFDEHPQAYTKDGNRYEAERLTIINDDLFSLTVEDVGYIDFVYDRASLIAFPLDMRMEYLSKMDALTPIGCQTMLITLEYFPLLQEPPFSVDFEAVQNYYEENHQIEHFAKPVREGHGMQRKFNLEYVIEHGFMLTKTHESKSFISP